MKEAAPSPKGFWSLMLSNGRLVGLIGLQLCLGWAIHSAYMLMDNRFIDIYTEKFLSTTEAIMARVGFEAGYHAGVYEAVVMLLFATLLTYVLVGRLNLNPSNGLLLNLAVFAVVYFDQKINDWVVDPRFRVVDYESRGVQDALDAGMSGMALFTLHSLVASYVLVVVWRSWLRSRPGVLVQSTD